MAKEITDLTPGTQGRLEYWAGQIIQNHNAHTTSLMDLCEAIAGAHNELAGVGADGLFKPWIESNPRIAMSVRSAYDHLKIWKRFNKCANLHAFDPDCLKLLSRQSDEVIKKAEKLAAKNQTVDGKVVRRLIKESKPPAEQTQDGKKDTDDKGARMAIFCPECNKPIRCLRCHPKKIGSFQPPTVAEIEEYCRQKGINDLDAEYFWSHHENNRWKTSGGKGPVMQDWRLAIGTWRKKKFGNGKKGPEYNEELHGEYKPHGSK